jgi:hypothetical protein
MGFIGRPSTGVSDTSHYDKPLPPLRTGSDLDWDGRRRMEIRERQHTPTGSYDDKPLPPIMDTLNEPLQGPRKPNMSLFSLFSRPKVQKLRGYAESGLVTPRPNNDAMASRTNLDDSKPHSSQELPRSTSSMSFRTHRTHGSNHKVRHPTARRVSQDHRLLNYDPPPLFQAFARSTKNGLVEVSTASPETVTAKSRTKRVGALHLPAEGTSRGSSDTSRSGDALRLGRFASRTSGSLNVTHVDLERKIFVLVTTGHLLQYSEYGPSGRLPEKVLVLGENSAAFASDLISGRPYVCQISQEVDDDGVPVPPSGSLFSKVGFRSTAEKKMIANVLLVLPDGEELNEWLYAVRQQIEEQGGPSSSHFGSTPAQIQVEQEQQEESAPMQRYHIRRASSQIEPPIAEGPDTSVSPIEVSPATEPMLHERTKSRGSIEEAEAFADMLAAGASYTKPRSSTDDAEAFGDMLAAGASYTKAESTRGRSPSDALSINSSAAQSVDHLRLSSLRSSVRMSTNTNVTGWTSRTNSLSSDHAPNKQSLESPNESFGPRGPYRNLSSYGTGSASKRRSAMPTGPPPPVPSGPAIDLTIKTKISSPVLTDLGEDSPVMGWNPSTSITALPPIAPRGKVLSSRQSMPLLTEGGSKHDSKIVPPPVISENGERPQSFVGDLPSSKHWATKLSTGKRSSKIQSPPTDKQMHRMSSAPSLRTSALSSAPRTARRNTSTPFTLPLKINPSGSPSSASWQNSRQMQSRQSQHSPDSSDPETPLPRISTLTAHVATDGNSPTTPAKSLPADNIPLNPTGPDDAAIPARNPTPPKPTAPAPAAPKRLSIFPSMQPNPTTLDNKHIPARVRPPSLSIPTSPYQPNSSKRPISIQIRASANLNPNSAPFLASLPNHQKGATRPSLSANRSFTPPIRSLKPSRPGSSTFRSRSSLPALDLGIPVVGLGPPAPPPMTPLPLPPTLGGGGSGRSSRAASPAPSGLGIRVGS